MQYDSNGYPIKGAQQQQQQQPPQQYQQQQPMPQPYQREYDSGAGRGGAPPAHYQQPQHYSPSSPTYDANGNPIKPSSPQQQLPYQQQQRPQYAAAAGPTYDANGNPIKPAHSNPQQQGGPSYGAVGSGAPMPSYAGGPQQPPQFQQQQQQPGPLLPHQQQFTPLQSPHHGDPNASQYQQQQQQQHQNQNYYHPGGGIPPVPIAAQNAVELAQRNYWTTGLCDIVADCDVCMETWCCGCCQEGRLYEAIEFDNPNTTNCSVCLLVSCFAPAWTFVSFFNRRSLIKKYNIQGEGCGTTLCFACCCPLQSSCQMQREVTARGINPGGMCCVTGGPSRLPPPRSMH